MIAKAILKPWGSSLGLVVPREVVRKEHLRAGQEIVIDVKPRSSLKGLFGSLPNWKIDSQNMKDELRREWSW